MTNIYITIIFFLFIGTFFSTFNLSNRIKKYIFFTCFLFMSIILIFRFGQGTDYFAYMYIYNRIGTASSIGEIFLLGLHGEYLWKTLNFLFNQMNFTFEVFILLLSVFFSFSLYWFIRTYVNKYRTLALILSFHYIYLVYFMSGLRQGLVLSIFMTVLLSLYKHENFKLFILITFVCAGFHKSALVLLLILIIPFIKKEKWIYLYFASFSLSIWLSIYNGINIFSLIQGSFLQLMERVLFLMLIIYLHRNSTLETKKDNAYLYKIYIIGFLVYIIFIYDHLICSRLSLYFRVIELILIPNLLYKVRISLINKMVIHYGIAILVCFLSIKNINASIVGGEYYSKNILDYPYVSIFNKNDIYKYRESDFFYLE